MKRFLCFLVFLSVFMMAVGCDDKSTSTSNPTSTTASALKIDFDTGEPQECDGPTDENCNAEGPGQRLICDADEMCHYYESDEDCTYAGLEGGDKSCEYTQCVEDGECEESNPDPDNLGAWCLYTEASVLSEIPGICFFSYDTCEALPNTPCWDEGVVYCANNECECNAEADMSQATTEVCDEMDNDCDGDTDETFGVGEACDSDDADDCENGTLTCAADELGTECVNESETDVSEVCDDVDNDCDGDTDDDDSSLDLSTASTWYADSDDDGYGDPDVSTQTCDVPEGYVSDNTDCDDTNADVNPGELETCTTSYDDNCDGASNENSAFDVSTWYADSDDDGYGDSDSTITACSQVVGTVADNTDCDDADSEVNPAATELCNSKDDDCDGETDEGYGLGDVCSDGDGVCLVDGTYDSCSEDGLSAVCSAEEDLDQQLDSEVCNGLDDTCDGTIDEGCDDDSDGYCDDGMVVGSGAACTSGDCNDDDADVSPEATEVCNGEDDDCDEETDEGCDDDSDGYCDEAMLFGAGAECESGDCDDSDAEIYPTKEEVCTTSYDDNCDDDTEFMLDGVTPACDSCANALELECGVEYEIGMATEPNASNAIDTYQCWTKFGAKTLTTTFSGKEVVIVPDAEAGTTFSLQILTSGTGTIAARLNSSCEPDEGTSAVTAYKEGSAIYDGTCAAYGTTSVSGGVVGEDFVALDAKTDQTVTVKFVCVAP